MTTPSPDTPNAPNPPNVAPVPTPEHRHLEHLYAVSDGHGFVGAFPSAHAAELAVHREYPGLPFLIQCFPAAPGPVDSVWVVHYRDIDAVACVSNDRAAAEKVRAALDSVGLGYPDDIDYWEQPLGRITPRAEERLKSQRQALAMYAYPPAPDELEKLVAADEERLRVLTEPRQDSPLLRLLRENERVTIFDCVVPVAFAAPDDETAAPEWARADGEPLGLEDCYAALPDLEDCYGEPPGLAEPVPVATRDEAPLAVGAQGLGTGPQDGGTSG